MNLRHALFLAALWTGALLIALSWLFPPRRSNLTGKFELFWLFDDGEYASRYGFDRIAFAQLAMFDGAVVVLLTATLTTVALNRSTTQPSKDSGGVSL